MPDLKHWLAKRKKKKEQEKLKEAAFVKSGRTKDVPVDDPISDSRLKEAEKRRKKYGGKVESSKGGDKLKEGNVGVYRLKGGFDEVGRKGKKRSVKKEKSAEYVIPGSKKETVTYDKATKIDPTIEFQTTVGGEYPKEKGTKIPGLEKDKPSNLKSTDWKEKSAEQMEKKGMPVKDPVKPTYKMKEVTVPKYETSAQKKERKAGKVALDNPDYLIKRKKKIVRKRGDLKPSKIKKKIVKEKLYGKEYKGLTSPDIKDSTDRNKVPDGKGGYTKTITKVRKGGDKIIEKRKTKIKREKINGQYRQHKKNIKLKKFSAKIKRRLKNK